MSEPFYRTSENRTRYSNDDFSFIIMADPQFGKEDLKNGGGDATDWSADVANVEKMCQDLKHEKNIAFILIAGDLAEAYPIVQIDEYSDQVGRLPGYRPAQDSGFKVFELALG